MVQSLSDALHKFPRVGISRAGTPLEPVARLTDFLGRPRLWVKREDLTGVSFDGNKLRKLDYVLHEAVTLGADTLVSGGVVQSNSQRQVAAAAAKLGLACHLAVYHGRLAPPTPEYETSGKALLNRLFGAETHDVPWDGDRNGAIGALCEELKDTGSGPVWCLTACPARLVRWAMPPPSTRFSRSRGSWISDQPRSYIVRAVPRRKRD